MIKDYPMVQANTAIHQDEERLPFADRLSKQKQHSHAALTKRVRLFDQLVASFLFLCGAISILTTIGFIIVLGNEAAKFFTTTEFLNVNKQLAVAICLSILNSQ
jgi:hypothetical protein